jgi:hypothetical protein
VDEYEPTGPQLQRVKSRISAASWRARVKQARADEVVIKQVLDEVARGASLNVAMARLLPAARRSWALRRIPRYRKVGFEALIDTRTPREPTVSRACRQAVQAARTANPRVTTTAVLQILKQQQILPLPSEATIKREFSRVDGRRRYAAQKQRAAHEVIELPYAGGELMLAAEAETGGMAALTGTVVRLAQEAHVAAQGQTPAKDVALRDRRGHFTVGYNRQRRRRAGEDIAVYLRPAADKAVGRVPTWPRFVRERAATLDPKLRMISLSWLVAATKGWAALRSPDATGLEPLTGFAYMPSTLAKLVSALAISGAGTPLLETVGQHWHHVAQTHFGEPGAMAAIYVDNHAKEVWSSLFTMSGKVSHRSRVMPCITTTYAHTGAGTPLVLSVQSGAAPLAPRLVALVDEAEELLGGAIERAVVIDAEGSTFDLLDSFAQRQRVLITPLRPARAPELELRYSRGSYYRPYREHDELRLATCTLTHKSSGRRLELGALLVRREHRDSDTVLLTNGLDLGFEGRDLADLYFRRWPVQENAFKEGAAAVALDQHRGNCGRMVANVAVVTELEKLAVRAQRDGEALARLTANRPALTAAAAATTTADHRAQAALATRRRRLDVRVAAGKTGGAPFARIAVEHQGALVHAEQTAAAATAAREALAHNEARTAKLEQQLADLAARQRHLEPQRAVRQLDVAQDMILTATKLTALQLISFAMRMYLAALPMTADTFISRVFSLRGRKEIEPTVERVVFYENPRDPEVTAVLHDACRRLNQRALQRDGRRLRYAVEPAPTATRSG